jgi:hypothetical protein
MKYLKLFETTTTTEFHTLSLDTKKTTPISDIIKDDKMVNWWNENKNDIQIKYFDFKTQIPILGCCVNENIIAINNKKPNNNTLLSFFVLLHESRHCKHVKLGLMTDYFKPVINNDLNAFKKIYLEVEKDANDYAFSVIYELELVPKTPQYSQFESGLRHNELTYHHVFNMLSNDIKKYGVSNLTELVLNMII